MLSRLAALMLLKGMARVEPIGRAPHNSVPRILEAKSQSFPPLRASKLISHPAAELLGLAVIAAGAFHLAWAGPNLGALSLVYAWALIRISGAARPALSFRFGFLAGFLVFAPQLAWFWNIFGAVALSLWAVLSFFTGLFTVLLHCFRSRFQSRCLWLVPPILWTGIEFFRSELYLLKFSWFSMGYLFPAGTGILPTGTLGVYSTGFAIFFLAALLQKRSFPQKLALLLVVTLLVNWPLRTSSSALDAGVKVAGIQLEFPPDLEVPAQLDRVLATHPDAQILVLSEYTFDGPVPSRVRDWCRRHGKYLIAGGKKEVLKADKHTFRNTAFVIGPNGEVVFQQGKSVPIQFFNDGLPALEQKVWHSPWGRIAIPVCYDLSYRRVTDRYIAAGAQAFIVPFMDVTDWGERQHRQHARIAPVRAGEYGLEIFRLGSSGISQHVDRFGCVVAQTAFPGQEEIIGEMLHMNPARLPLDYWMAPVCSILCAVAIFLLLKPFGQGFMQLERRAPSSRRAVSKAS